MSDAHSIKSLCAVLSVSRSGYYAWLRAADSVRVRHNERLRLKIVEVHRQFRHTYTASRF